MRERAVLVTGSSSGIGLGIARQFLAAGARVAINSYEPAESAAIAPLLADLTSQFGTLVTYFPADLSRPGAGSELVAKFIVHFGQLDILVNNAGIQKVSPIETFPPADWARIRAIILDAAFETISTAIPGMKERQWGRIVNIASAHALVASPYKSAYVSAKHGLLGLTKTVALEVARDGITINAICPGYVRTPLVEAQLDDQAKTHGMTRQEVIDKIMLAPQPIGKFVEIEEVAALALYLAGDMARSITGTAISVDGGWTAR